MSINGLAKPGDSGRPSRQDHVLLGILFMLGATVMFAGSSALAKWQVATYPFGEVLFIRSVASLATCAALILPQTGLAVFRTRHLRDHAMRGVSQGCAQSFLVIALGLMPLAGVISINFSAPLFATLFSALLIKEVVGAARWGALVVGFGGVLVVAAPGADSLQLGALFAVMNAVLYGAVTAAVRGMTATESAETLTMYQMVFLAVLFALLLPFAYVAPTAGDAFAMVMNGVLNAVGQYWWTRALHLAPASAVTPFYYFSLVWAIVLGFLFWGDVPTLALLVGSAVVVGSGLFLLWWEAGKARADVQ